MNMNKVFFRRKEDCIHKWHVIDGKGKIFGRLATEIADILTGKTKTDYAKHSDNGDYVVVINSDDIMFTGNKMENKTYIRVSGYIGGKKEISAKLMKQKHPTALLEHAVKGMLPKNKHQAICMKRLKVYTGADHPHEAQMTDQ